MPSDAAWEQPGREKLVAGSSGAGHPSHPTLKKAAEIPTAYTEALDEFKGVRRKLLFPGGPCG